MNVILFLTDQERAIQHFPPGWAKQNLPGQRQLKQNGLTFPRAFCAASMCSPSRSSMMTGYFPAQTGVKWTLEQTMQGPKYPHEALETEGLLENTLIIRSSDHGEMGLAHGGLRQKNFNFYEESLRVPLIYSNPKLYPKPAVSQAMISHVDHLPTLASLFGAPASARANWQGVDYSEVVLNPAAEPPQQYVVFTYDDYQSGQTSEVYPRRNNHIVSIREERYKLARYYDPAHPAVPVEWEMYDLLTDPLEATNLAYSGYQRTPHEEAESIVSRQSWR
jgi:arylsulfatase A-like enzyme